MTQAQALKEVEAFAEVFGFTVIRGIGLKSHTYTIAKQYGNAHLPHCQYMEPSELAIWADGYRAGLANADDAPTQAEE